MNDERKPISSHSTLVEEYTALQVTFNQDAKMTLESIARIAADAAEDMATAGERLEQIDIALTLAKRQVRARDEYRQLANRERR